MTGKFAHMHKSWTPLSVSYGANSTLEVMQIKEFNRIGILVSRGNGLAATINQSTSL